MLSDKRLSDLLLTTDDTKSFFHFIASARVKSSSDQFCFLRMSTAANANGSSNRSQK